MIQPQRITLEVIELSGGMYRTMYDCTDALLGVEKADDEDWGLDWRSRGQSLGHDNHDRVWG